MRSIRIPAEIILTFPPQVKITEEVVEVAMFSCEQHFNSIGMITYKGDMLQVGTLQYGVRAHFNPTPQITCELKETKTSEPEIG
jgi:hypothetical protein